jgi:hypothetical protein
MRRELVLVVGRADSKDVLIRDLEIDSDWEKSDVRVLSQVIATRLSMRYTALRPEKYGN